MLLFAIKGFRYFRKAIAKIVRKVEQASKGMRDKSSHKFVYSNTPSCEEVFHHLHRSFRKCMKAGLYSAFVKISAIWSFVPNFYCAIRNVLSEV
jgi:hypothetical protein